MGFISDAWIHPGIATGNYGVTQVHVVASRPTSEFSRRHGLVMRIRVERVHSGDHQVLHFDSADLLHLLTASMQEVGSGLRAEMVSAMLGEMSDRELLSALDAEVSRRRERDATG